MIKRYWLPLAMVLAALTVWVIGDTASEALMYQRDGIVDGHQWWRLITGHWVHLGGEHLALNLAGLTLIWSLFEDRLQPVLWLAVTVLTGLGLSLCLLLFHPGIVWYVGLSGILQGMLVVGALLSLRQNPILAWGALAVTVAKLVTESLHGADPRLAQLLGGAIVTHAHLYGALWGGISAGLILLSRRAGYRTSPP
ncbi:rhombosortase [Marinobacter caseinilyticus]|uniref:rhombosortase n=1 Tax=Marinobacter caseinilyticus TaxID=2692195 RepID=UPI001A94BCDA|nr:rhombosortase [Marinobacter caseinilyticus]